VGRIAKVILGGILLFGLASGVRAQWSQDSLENTPICACWGEEFGGPLITDGAGGAIVFISAMRHEYGDMGGSMLFSLTAAGGILIHQRQTV